MGGCQSIAPQEKDTTEKTKKKKMDSGPSNANNKKYKNECVMIFVNRADRLFEDYIKKLKNETNPEKYETHREEFR